MKDAFGAVLTLIRDDPEVAAIVAGRVSSEPEGPPSVELKIDAITRRPFGPGSGRIGMQMCLFIARCYGTDSPTGSIAAQQLAGEVSDALHNIGPTKVGTTYLAHVIASEIDGPQRDPGTRWPYVDVHIDAYAGAQAVA